MPYIVYKGFVYYPYEYNIVIMGFNKSKLHLGNKNEWIHFVLLSICITFAVPYNGEDNNDYVDGKGFPVDIAGCTREFANTFAFRSFARQFCCNDGSLEAAQSRVMARAMKNNFQESDTYEKMQFYYHPDHLGSSSYITNLDGEVVQHIEYVPFGEVFVEERNNTWNTPYLFNAKEFDEETGLYYYGARYYEPRVSLWMNVDRYAEITLSKRKNKRNKIWNNKKYIL